MCAVCFAVRLLCNVKCGMRVRLWVWVGGWATHPASDLWNGKMSKKKFSLGGQMMGLWVFYVCFSYSILAVYTSANFIYVCWCVYVSVSGFSIVFLTHKYNHHAQWEEGNKCCKVIVQGRIRDTRIRMGEKEFNWANKTC